MSETYAEYGFPLIGPEWAPGEMVWLRAATGPILVQAIEFVRGLLSVTTLEPDAIPMMVPVERLAWTKFEAVLA